MHIALENLTVTSREGGGAGKVGRYGDQE